MAKNVGKLFVQTHLSSLKSYWHAGFAQESKTKVSALSVERQGNLRLHFFLLRLPSVDISLVSHHWQSRGERDERKSITWEFVQTEPRSVGLHMRIPLIWIFCNY